MRPSIKRSAGHANTRSCGAALLTPQACYVHAVNNRDGGRIILRIDEELRAKADAVLYGFQGGGIKEFNRVIRVIFRVGQR